MVGMAIMLNLVAVAKFSSVLSLPNATFPLYSFAKVSMMGPTILQGPHQGAQQSTRVSWFFDTNWSKLESVIVTGASCGEDIAFTH